VTGIYTSTINIYNFYANVELTQAGLASYSIIKSVDAIFFSCYYAFFEYYTAILLYTGTVSDIGKLGYNLVHNLGKIYDLIAELIYRCMDWDT
jgi:hypothetical protein